MKRVIVVFALPERQWSWPLELPEAATVGEALAQARALAGDLSVPWDGPTGIFGVLCERSALPRDGDRVEVYRALKADPKESRRERARARKAAPDREPSRVPKESSR